MAERKGQAGEQGGVTLAGVLGRMAGELAGLRLQLADEAAARRASEIEAARLDAIRLELLEERVALHAELEAEAARGRALEAALTAEQGRLGGEIGRLAGLLDGAESLLLRLERAATGSWRQALVRMREIAAGSGVAREGARPEPGCVAAVALGLGGAETRHLAGLARRQAEAMGRGLLLLTDQIEACAGEAGIHLARLPRAGSLPRRLRREGYLPARLRHLLAGHQAAEVVSFGAEAERLVAALPPALPGETLPGEAQAASGEAALARS